MKHKIVVKGCFLGFIVGLIFTVGCKKNSTQPDEPEPIVFDTTYTVNIYGNTFVTVSNSEGDEVIDRVKGISNWLNNEVVISTYFKVQSAGKIGVNLNGKLVNSGDKSKISISVNGVSNSVELTGIENEEYSVGVFDVPEGYVKVDFQGVSKSGETYGEISELMISVLGDADGLIYCNDSTFPEKVLVGPTLDISTIYSLVGPASYYYFEVKAPSDNGPVSPFSFNAEFESGAFRFKPQSNNMLEMEFYIQSPSPAMDPFLIPTLLNRKGENVIVTGLDPGTGPDVTAILKRNWNPNNTYKFLLHANPDGNSNTDFTIWYLDSETQTWNLFVSLSRGWTNERFNLINWILKDDQNSNGFTERHVTLSNIWAFDRTNQWKKIEKLKIKTDQMVKRNQRVDLYYEAIENGISMKTSGFFPESKMNDEEIEIINSKSSPEIDFSDLP